MNHLIGAYDIKNRCLMVRPRAFPSLIIALFLAWTPVLAVAAPGTSSTTPINNFEEERWFQVELILFAQLNGKAMEAEQWPDIEGLALPEKLLELTLPTDEPEPLEEIPDDAQIDITPLSGLAAGETTALIFEEVTIEEAPPAMPVAYQILETEDLQLNDVMKKLQRSKQFKPLLHVVWQQPTVAAGKTTPIFLFEGMTDPLPVKEVVAEAVEEAVEDVVDEIFAGESTEEATDTTIAETTTIPEEAASQDLFPLAPIFATEEDTNIGPENPRFAGTVRLSVTRYLHLAADLVYRTPVTQQAAIPISDLELWYDRPYPTLRDPQGPAYQLEEWQAVRGFRMRESRRMRSKEIHYLDHPFFGMVVLVTPVELPQPEPPAEIKSPIYLDPPNVNTSPAGTNGKKR